MRDENYVGIIYSKTKKYNSHKDKNWFCPAVKYPEFNNMNILSKQNDVYETVREALHLMEFDKANFGTDRWNPLGEIVKPGDTVLIKPNMVMDYNRSGEGVDCLYTNAQVIVPIIDYVILALDGKGKIIIGDAPMQECRFDKLIRESGYEEIVEFYRNKNNLDIELVDFRGLITTIKGGRHRGIRHQTIKPEAYGKVINLGKQSEFYKYDEEHLSKLRITNYSPDRLREHHTGEKHEYYVSGYVLDADVIIDLPKPKTHRKAGFTAAMKNMVGINVRKEYLPHHTIGAIQDGGDEYKNRSLLRQFDDRLYDLKNTCEGKEKYLQATILWYIAGVLKVLTSRMYKDEAEGSWYGNETISKTIVDLNKILQYADKEGHLSTEIQRRVIHVGDMIISGEKEGPVAPSPKQVGAIVIATNAFAFDYAVGVMMGAKIEKIPFIKDAKMTSECLKLIPEKEITIISNDSRLNALEAIKVSDSLKWKFVPTKGWTELFDKR